MTKDKTELLPVKYGAPAPEENLQIRIENKISQGVLAKLGTDFHSKINIINVGQVNIGPSGTKVIDEETLHNTLSNILNLLPEPRLDSLINLAINVAIRNTGGKSQAARYLGRTARGLSNRLKA